MKAKKEAVFNLRQDNFSEDFFEVGSNSEEKRRVELSRIQATSSIKERLEKARAKAGG